MTSFTSLISADELAENIDHCIVVDCRHELSDPQSGRKAYQQAHIPGAHFMHLDDDLSSPKTGLNGRHPLPDPADMAARLSAIGVGPDTQLVVYDAAGGMVASRLWWMARWLGHDKVAVLDGGIDAWSRAGFPLNAEPPRQAPPVDASWASPGKRAVVDIKGLQKNIETKEFLVIDARGSERFRGETEPMDSRAGHIPGAVNRPFTLNLRDNGLFKPPAVLRQEFTALLDGRSPEQTAHSCGSGVSACHNLVAMAAAGLDGARLYPGSWSEWSSHEELPAASGE